MREAKYRAWDKIAKPNRMKSWEQLLAQYQLTLVFTSKDFELMQFTGLYDKNGKEIYEGDIVRVMDSTLAMVKYSDDRGAYYLDCEKKIGDVGLICQYDTIKRVGSIHENPELLEKGEKKC